MYGFLSYRVPFSEVDAMGIVHHSNYARYFERGRVDFLRLLGLPYSEIVRRGLHIPLLSMETIFRRPVKFNDVALVETRLSALSRARVEFCYRLTVVDEEFLGRISPAPFSGETHTTAVTRHCVVNEEGRPKPIPEELLDLLSPHLLGGQS